MKLVSSLLAATAAGVAAADRNLASSCAPQADFKGVAYGACAPDGSARPDILTACGADTGAQDDDFIGIMRDLFVCPNGALVSQEIGAGRDFGFEQCVSDGLKAAYCPDSKSPSSPPSSKPSTGSPSAALESNAPSAATGKPSTGSPSAQPVAFVPVPTPDSSHYAPFSLAPFSPVPSAGNGSPSGAPSSRSKHPSGAPSFGSGNPSGAPYFSFAPSAGGEAPSGAPYFSFSPSGEPSFGSGNPSGAPYFSFAPSAGGEAPSGAPYFSFSPSADGEAPSGAPYFSFSPSGEPSFRSKHPSGAPSFESGSPSGAPFFSFPPSAGGTDGGQQTGMPTGPEFTFNGTDVMKYWSNGNSTVGQSHNETLCLDPREWDCGNTSTVALPRSANFSGVCAGDVSGGAWYARNCSWMGASLSYAPTGNPTSGPRAKSGAETKTFGVFDGTPAGDGVGAGAVVLGVLGTAAGVYVVMQGKKPVDEVASSDSVHSVHTVHTGPDAVDGAGGAVVLRAADPAAAAEV